MKVFVNDVLVAYTHLVSGFCKTQLSYSLYGSDTSSEIILNGVDNLVVGNSALNNVVAFPWLFAPTTAYDEIEPFAVVLLKAENTHISGQRLFEKLIFGKQWSVGCTDYAYPSCPALGLLADGGNIETGSEIKLATTDIGKRFRHTYERTMIYYFHIFSSSFASQFFKASCTFHTTPSMLSVCRVS